MTLKSLRKQLEGDLGLEADALKPHKHLLSGLIDKVRHTGAARLLPLRLYSLAWARLTQRRWVCAADGQVQ